MTRDELRLLAAHPDWGMRCQAAAHPELPDDLVLKLASDPAWEVQVVIAGRPTLAPEVLDPLKANRDWRVRYAANRRANPNAQR